MPWLEFTSDFDFRIKKAPPVIVSYRKGSRHLVKQACVDEALKQGKARIIARDKISPAR